MLPILIDIKPSSSRHQAVIKQWYLTSHPIFSIHEMGLFVTDSTGAGGREKYQHQH